MTRRRDDLPRYFRLLLDGVWTPEPNELIEIESPPDGDAE